MHGNSILACKTNIFCFFVFFWIQPKFGLPLSDGIGEGVCCVILWKPHELVCCDCDRGCWSVIPRAFVKYRLPVTNRKWNRLLYWITETPFNHCVFVCHRGFSSFVLKSLIYLLIIFHELLFGTKINIKRILPFATTVSTNRIIDFFKLLYDFMAI